MNRTQRHRGPNDEGTWSTRLADGTLVGLGSTRLSILDLSSAGHMPMHSEDGSLTLVYNGELYNFKELRERLLATGVRFRSRGDTEVVLQMYARFGARCVEFFRGMFAFAVWDASREEVFLARDHFGIKPLYHTGGEGRFAFASEMKALLHLPGLMRRIDPMALQQYLTMLWVPDPKTMFQGVELLPAGHTAFFGRRGLRIEPYWDLRFPDADHPFSGTEADLAAEFRSRFSQSVKEQMVSDVPMGAFLSAGLDSNSIVRTMSDHTSDPVRTFTITFPRHTRIGEVHLDNPDVAREAAAGYGCLHREIEVEPNVVSLLPDLVYHMDEPTADPALIMAYLVCRAASEDATVLLSGIGGDEIFAGYRKYRAHYLAQTYRRIPSSLRKRVIEPAVRRLPSFRDTPLKGYVRLAKKMIRSGGLADDERFLMDSVYLDRPERMALCTEEVWAEGQSLDPFAAHRAALKQVERADPLNRMLYLDSKFFMVSLNLTYNDRMSMANSVEVRVPFLDHELVQWVADHVAPSLKIKGSTGKYLLRQAVGGQLPSKVLRQTKAGFGAPIDYWIRNDLREMVTDLLSPDTVRRRALFRPSSVARLIDEHLRGAEDHSFQIWQLLTLELWQRRFMDS